MSISEISKRRPWWRLHLSTLLLLVPVVALLAALIVPVTVQDDPLEAFYYGERGWPWVFAKCGIASLHYEDWEFGEAPWLYLRNWIAPLDFDQLKSGALALDAIVALVVLLMAAVAIEVRRRRRRRAWQFTIRDLLALTLLVAAGAGWLAMVKHQRDSERAALQQLWPFLGMSQTDTGALELDEIESDADRDALYDDSPRWVQRLVPSQYRGWFERRHGLDLGSATDDRAARPRLADLMTFSRLEELSIDGGLLSEADLLALVDRASLKKLDVCGFPLRQESIERLARRRSIVRLTFQEVPLTEADVRALAASPVVGRKLYLTRVRLTDSMIETLVRSASLARVMLFECRGFSDDIDERIFRLRPNDEVVWAGGTMLIWAREADELDMLNDIQ